ncbi:DUF4421 family protein [Gaoshiqia sp. Z1-71]|uniref:DUF4421 family protein n=1 Tax=Gaoshiqia hydrogeniformans TaxID=3290090 RepID=UPI003BF8611B
MKTFALGCFFLLNASLAFSRQQERSPAQKQDSTYIQSCYHDLVIRAYSANKNNFVRFHDLSEMVRLKYRPNDYFNLGLGFDYKWFGLKLGTKVPFLSRDDDRFGRTSNYGLQSYLYTRKFTIDVLALKTRGYHLDREDGQGLFIPGEERYYQRRDLVTKNLGVNLNYVLNNRKFSYKAAFKQTDIQLKSAGSLVFGGGVHLLKVEADSAFVPSEIGNSYFKTAREQNHLEASTLNANLGYAYSLVPTKNWIITGSYRFSLGLQQNVWHMSGEEADYQTKLSRGDVFQLSAGYFFPRFFIGTSFIRYQQNSRVQYRMLSILNGTNFIEFNISKRIKL